MTDQTQNCYSLKPQDIPKVVEVLFDAFQNDPVFNAIFEGSNHMQRSALYETTLRYCRHYGQVWAPSTSLEGVAGWVRGKHASLTPWRMLISGAMWAGLKMGQTYSQRMSTVFKPIDDGRKEHMKGQPFLYLFMIGVASKYQGQGYGRVLLDEVIHFAEREGLPVYLETETQENVRLYQYFDFEVIEKVDLPLVNLPMWEMVRKPD